MPQLMTRSATKTCLLPKLTGTSLIYDGTTVAMDLGNPVTSQVSATEHYAYLDCCFELKALYKTFVAQ